MGFLFPSSVYSFLQDFRSCFQGPQTIVRLKLKVRRKWAKSVCFYIGRLAQTNNVTSSKPEGASRVACLSTAPACPYYLTGVPQEGMRLDSDNAAGADLPAQ